MTGDDRIAGERSPEVSNGENATNPHAGVGTERDQLAQLTLDYLDILNGGQDALPALDDLSTELRKDVLDAWSTIDRLVADEPLPLLSEDPIAIALGAIPTALLNPTALREARQARSLRPSDIAETLQRRGWLTTTSDVFRWEQHAERIAPALLADLAATLGVSNEALLHVESSAKPALDATGPDDSMRPFLQVLYSDELHDIVDQWAQLQGITINAARDELQQRVAVAVHRGEQRLTNRQWKAILVVLLADERTRRGRSDDPLTGK
jgi:hypothetical protein